MTATGNRLLRPGSSFVLSIALLALVVASPALAQVTVVFDHGPSSGTIADLGWTNQTAGQNFADRATLTNTTEITGIAIYCDRAPEATAVHIKILADNAGVPGAVLYAADVAPFSWEPDAASGGYKITAFLPTPFTAQGGTTYWYGLSGNQLDITQASIHAPDDDHMAQFNGGSYSFSASVGDQCFQLLNGTVEPIPALDVAGLLALALLLGIAGIAAIRRLT